MEVMKVRHQYLCLTSEECVYSWASLLKHPTTQNCFCVHEIYLVDTLDSSTHHELLWSPPALVPLPHSLYSVINCNVVALALLVRFFDRLHQGIVDKGLQYKHMIHSKCLILHDWGQHVITACHVFRHHVYGLFLPILVALALSYFWFQL